MSDLQPPPLPPQPRRLATLIAILAIGLTLQAIVRNETPVGGVEGEVYLTDSHRRLSGVRITLRPEPASPEAPPIRHAVSGPDGRFALQSLPEGDYSVTASTHSHREEGARIHVSEGQVTPLSLGLERTLPNFKAIVHQRIWGTNERAHLAVRGYVDSLRGPHRDTYRLRIYRTRLSSTLQDPGAARALEEVGRYYDAAPRLPTALLHPANQPVPTLLLDREAPLRDEDREGFYYHTIPLEKLTPGLYLLDLQHAKDTDCAWLLVTDTALILKRAASQLVAFATDMKSGQPLPNCTIRTYRAGRPIVEGRTDARGLVELKVPPLPEGDDDDLHPITVAIRGDDEAVVDRDGNTQQAGDRYTVHAYTDRPLYRPGQRIQFKAIVRRDVPEPETGGLQAVNAPPPTPGPRYAVPPALPVQTELLDPNGDPVVRTEYRLNAYGSLFGSAELPSEAMTGVYTLKLRLAGVEYTHQITVASYRKPEYSVTITPDKPRYTRGETVTLTLSAQYFFGAPVSGAQVEYGIYSSPDWAAEYPDDYGYDPGEDAPPAFTHYRGDSYYGGSVKDGKTTLGPDGKATVTFTARGDTTDSDAQVVLYTCHASVTAGANRTVEGEGQARVVAGDFRLTVAPEGYVAAPGRPTAVTVTARDHDGHLLPNVPFTLEPAYESWQDGSYHRRPLGALHGVTDTTGRTTLSVTPPRTGDLALTALAEDSAHRRIQGRASLWVADDAGGDLDTTYTDLSLLTDRRNYAPGDTARVLINANRVGETALITLEGDRVYRSQVVRLDRHSTVIYVPLSAAYGPNVFLSACYVRNKQFSRSDVPLRVALPSRELHVTLTEEKGRAAQAAKGQELPNAPAPGAPAALSRYVPGERITYHVATTDEQGRPARCEFSLGVVDEALYALQEDDPNALRDSFYPRRMNAVVTIYSFAAEYLGDADKSEPKISARKKFPDVAFWAPAVQTDARGEATLSFSLPDSLTTWRATLTAHTLDTRLGRAVTKVIVAKPFLVRVETPRTLTQQDRSEIIALVHNETGQPQTAQVRLHAPGLTVTTGAVQTVDLPSGGMGEVHWPVIAETYGVATVTVTAWTRRVGGVQYTDGMETTLPIRAHGVERAAAFAGELTASHAESEVLRFDPNAVPGTGRLTVRITPSVAAALTGGLDYLTGYPYGCVEQTLSRMLPDLLVQRALRRQGLGDVPDAPKLPRMVRESLARLYRFQHESGAWGWWEHDTDDAWMTAYVLYGLATAKHEGYPVSGRALAKGCAAAEALLPRTRLQDRPFLMYALALNGRKEGVAKVRHRIEPERLSAEGIAYTALTDRLLGADVSPVFALLDRRAIPRDTTVHWRDDGSVDDAYGGVSATAVALQALLAIHPDSPQIEGALRWLMSRRTGAYWVDTRDTSAVLAAFCDLLDRLPQGSQNGQVEVRLNGTVVRTYALGGTDRERGDLVFSLPGTALRPGKNDVTLTRRDGSSPVFYSVELRQTVAMDRIPAQAARGLTVTREYLKVVGRDGASAGWGLKEEPTHNLLKAGDAVRVRLTIDAPRDLDYVLVEDAFPAGCEVNERGDAEDVTDWSVWWNSVDVRDDRVAFFAHTLTKGRHVIEYNLRARTPGVYRALPTLVQPMYVPDTRALTAEDTVEVR